MHRESLSLPINYKYGDPVTMENRMDVLVDSFTIARNLFLIQIPYFQYLERSGAIPSVNWIVKEFVDRSVMYEDVFEPEELKMFESAYEDFSRAHRNIPKEKYRSELALLNYNLLSAEYMTIDMTQQSIDKKLKEANYSGDREFSIQEFYDLEPEEARDWLDSLAMIVRGE